jgi:predicted transposase/invertase (TIGR01784 family)
MRFLDPRTDFAFKKIFGSENHPEVLISLLNAVLDDHIPAPIEAVQILNPYLAPKIKGMKDTYLDIKAKDTMGNYFVVEMQVLNVEGFEKRILYNACKAYAGQLDQAKHYHTLTPEIAVIFTDFVMFPELKQVVSCFQLREQSLGVLCNEDLTLVFTELPKFEKTEDELSTVLDKWLYFLKHAGSLAAIPKSLESDASIHQAFEIANKANLSRQELDEQENREIFIQDQRGALSLAHKKGHTEGRQEERATIARNMLANYDDETIAKVTGLTLEQYRSLRN